MTIEDLTMLILFILIAPFLSYGLVLIVEEGMLEDFSKERHVVHQAFFKAIIMTCSIIPFPFIVMVYIYRDKSNWKTNVKGYYKEITRVT